MRSSVSLPSFSAPKKRMHTYSLTSESTTSFPDFSSLCSAGIFLPVLPRRMFNATSCALVTTMYSFSSMVRSSTTFGATLVGACAVPHGFERILFGIVGIFFQRMRAFDYFLLLAPTNKPQPAPNGPAWAGHHARAARGHPCANSRHPPPVIVQLECVIRAIFGFRPLRARRQNADLVESARF